MKSTLLFARYLMLGLFVACNAIICSISVWNHSLVQVDGGSTSQVDVYLIFLGAFSLAFVMAITFADLLCKDPFSAQVWFECVWVAVIWLMELAGAAAVTAIAPDTECTSKATMLNICSSIHVLMAFTWICTIILIPYLFLILVTAVTTERFDAGVWQHNIRYLHIGTTRQCLPSAQNSPTTAHFDQGPGELEVHNPRALRPILPIYQFHTGLSSEYEVEPYRPNAANRTSMDSFLSLPEARPAPPVSYPTPAFIYAQNVSRSIPPQTASPPAPRLYSSIVYTNPVRPSIPAQQAQASQAPPPFNWPRMDVMKQPVKTRKKPLPSAFEFPRPGVQGPSDSNPPTESLPHPRTRRPSGPRMRVPSNDEAQRPAPYLTRPYT